MARTGKLTAVHITSAAEGSSQRRDTGSLKRRSYCMTWIQPVARLLAAFGNPTKKSWHTKILVWCHKLKWTKVAHHNCVRRNVETPWQDKHCLCLPMFICSPRVVSQLSRLVTALVRRQAISGMLKPLKNKRMSSSNIKTSKHQYMVASLVHKVWREEGQGHCLVEPSLEPRPLLLRICSTVADPVLMRAWVRGYVEPTTASWLKAKPVSYTNVLLSVT